MTVTPSPAGPDPALRRTLEEYFASRPFPGVVSARLFGSHAWGRPHRESDVDVAVLVDWTRYPSRLERSRLRVDLISDLIGKLHRNEVDLVVMNDLPPLFARRIVHEGLLLFREDQGADRAFADQIRSRAADLEPWLRKMARIKLEALRR
jgi:predicted nucleotidyltransferase